MPKAKRKPKSAVDVNSNRLLGIGKIYPKDSMFLRIHVGEATEGKRKYEMSQGVAGGGPLIHSKQTGKWFTIGWKELLHLAIKAGIDA